MQAPLHGRASTMGALRDYGAFHTSACCVLCLVEFHVST